MIQPSATATSMKSIISINSINKHLFDSTMAQNHVNGVSSLTIVFVHE